MTQDEAPDTEGGARREDSVRSAPRGRDAALIAEILGREGVEARVCPSPEALCEALPPASPVRPWWPRNRSPARRWSRWCFQAEQPTWSDFPFLVLTSGGAVSQGELRRLSVLGPLGNVAFLERPVGRRITLLCAVRAALRARRRQYQVRDHIAARERAEEALREADRRKDEFLATLAHELRNPMAPIRNGLEILRIAAHDPDINQESRIMMDRQLPRWRAWLTTCSTSAGSARARSSPAGSGWT